MQGSAETGSLVASTIAAILASACCAGPLILVSLGLSGAWLSNLTVLEPYRWILVVIAAGALVFAWRRIYRSAGVCAPGDVCAAPRTRRVYKTAFWTVAAVVGLATVFPYMARLFY